MTDRIPEPRNDIDRAKARTASFSMCHGECGYWYRSELLDDVGCCLVECSIDAPSTTILREGSPGSGRFA